MKTSRNTILNRVIRKTTSVPAAVVEPRCPQCGGSGLKSGHRTTRRGKVQKLYCRSCARYFGASPIPRRWYSPATVVEAVTAYHLGHTLLDTQHHLLRRVRKVVPLSTIHSWLRHFASICTFSR